MESKKPICKRCESATVYVLKNDTVVCRRCGYKTKKEKKKNKEKK